MKFIKNNKRGDMTGLFVFAIMSFIVILFSAVFIYMGNITEDQLKGTLGGDDPEINETIENTFGDVNDAYAALYWIALFLIFGQIIGIFIGSYMVTTRPVFFVPWIFLIIISIIVGVGISNGYEMIMNTPTLADTFAGFVGANEIMLNLPLILTIVGFMGGIIMFSQIGKGRQQIV